jgi:polyphosphate kinase
VLLTSVIRAHLGELFPGREVEAFSQFRVTRDSDLEVDEDDVTNLRQALRSGLTTRHFGQAIRLEVVNTCPPSCRRSCSQQFELPEYALHRVNGPVNLVRLNELIDQADDPRGGRRCASRPTSRRGRRGGCRAKARSSNACARVTCCCTIRSRASSR